MAREHCFHTSIVQLCCWMLMLLVQGISSIEIPCVGIVTYEARLTTQWERKTFLQGVPTDAYFSPFLGMTHNRGYHAFSENTIATGAVANFVETGNPQLLKSDLVKERLAGRVATSFASKEAQNIRAVDVITVQFNVGTEHSFVSLIGRTNPGPDWFIGIDAFNLCDTELGKWRENIEIDLKWFDAGTLSQTGNDWTPSSGNSNNWPKQNPIQPVREIVGQSPYTGTIPTLATINFSIINYPLCRARTNPTYKMTVKGAIDPNIPNLPASMRLGHIYGAAHAGEVAMYRLGVENSEAYKKALETGDMRPIKNEMRFFKSFAGNVVGEEIEGPDIQELNAPINVIDQKFTTDLRAAEGQTFEIKMDPRHPYVSFMSKILPSPDWFVGLSGFKLCNGEDWSDSFTLDLNLIDGGVHTEKTWASSTVSTRPTPYSNSQFGVDIPILPLFGSVEQVKMAEVHFEYIPEPVVPLLCPGDFLYDLSFIGKWDTVKTSATGGSFSNLIAFSHSEDFNLVQSKSSASQGLKTFATSGNFSALLLELQKERALGNVGDVSKSLSASKANSQGVADGMTSGLVVDHRFPFITFITVLTTSPDWVYVANSAKMCNEKTGTWLESATLNGQLFDVGVKLGNTFSATQTGQLTPNAVIVELKPQDETPFKDMSPDAGAHLDQLAVIKVEKRVIPVCTALGSRTYKLTFTGTPKVGRIYPDNFTFSPLIGITHAADADVFDVGGIPDQQILQFAESGNQFLFTIINSMNQASGKVGAVLTSEDTMAKDGSTTLTFRVSKERPYISILSAVEPSPDWFVGMDSISLCRGDQWLPSFEVRLPLLDAGTQLGSTWGDGDGPQSKEHSVSRIGIDIPNYPDFANASDNEFATVNLVRQEVTGADKDPCRGSATYSFTFSGTWSELNFPNEYPGKDKTFFSRIIGTTHEEDVQFITLGEVAEQAMEMLAEDGDERPLYTSLITKRLAGKVGTVFTSPSVPEDDPFNAIPDKQFGSTESTTTIFSVDESHDRVSFFSRLDPSPDWLIGLTDITLCDHDAGDWKDVLVIHNVNIYDAGTDDGEHYRDKNTPSIPQRPFSLINESSLLVPFANNTNRIGFVTFNRIDLPGIMKQASPCEGTAEYTLTFQGIWTKTQPLNVLFGNYPQGASFSPPLAITHDEDVQLFRRGVTASDSFKTWIEKGGDSTSLLSTFNEIKNFYGNIGEIKTSSLPYILTDGTATITITVSPDHPFISLVSRILPSPDWFVGIDAKNMCDHNTKQWIPFDSHALNINDAGIDDGLHYLVDKKVPSPPFVTVARIGADVPLTGIFTDAERTTYAHVLVLKKNYVECSIIGGTEICSDRPYIDPIFQPPQGGPSNHAPPEAPPPPPDEGTKFPTGGPDAVANPNAPTPNVVYISATTKLVFKPCYLAVVLLLIALLV